MERKLSTFEIVCVLIGLIGVLLLWTGLDRGGWILYLSFLLIAVRNVISFFSLNPYQRTKTQIIKVALSSLMFVSIVTHIIWGGEPLFGLLAALLLLQSIINLEPKKSDIPEGS